ncbi:MAG: hypothetical protein ABEI52_09025, partial [Halobacteriaceae archaeon]
MIKSIVCPNGTLNVLGMQIEGSDADLLRDLEAEEQGGDLSMVPSLVEKFGTDGIFTNYTDV